MSGKIQKLYKTTSKCEDQQKYKEMIKAALFSTPEVITDNSTMKPNPYVSTNNSSAIQSLHQFTKTLDVNHKTAVWRFGTSKAKHKAI